MSLVNRMLRDLDARRAGEGERIGLPAAVTPLAARQDVRGGLPWLWVGVAVVATGLGAGVWLSAHDAAPPAPVAPPPAATTPAVAPAVRPPPAPGAEPAPLSLRLADEIAAPPTRAAEPARKPATVPKAAGEPKPAGEPKAATANPEPVRPPVVALPRIPPSLAEASIDKQVRLPSAAERAEQQYRRGVVAQRQGNAEQAAASFLAALDDYPEHAAARQAMAALLIDAKRFDEAEEFLRKGSELPASRLAATLAWARLKVERGQAPAALELLLKNAAAGERSAEYQGFAGALLNRAGRAAEAVERYQAATRLAPNEGRWWLGLGLALEADGRLAEAKEAMRRSIATATLSVELSAVAEQHLR